MSIVTLRPLDFAKARDIAALRVSDQQAPYVAPNAISIAEGLLNPGGWLRSIHAGDRAVGFVMLNDPKVPGAIVRGEIETDCILLWRLMIDREHQQRGYAKAALDLVVAEARRRGAISLVTSFVPGEHSPEGFYLRYGFTRTGRQRANGSETELVLNLA